MDDFGPNIPAAPINALWFQSLCLLAAMADLAALQAKLQTLYGLAAGVRQH